MEEKQSWGVEVSRGSSKEKWRVGDTLTETPQSRKEGVLWLRKVQESGTEGRVG